MLSGHYLPSERYRTVNHIPPEFLNVFGFIEYKQDGSLPWATTDEILLSDEYKSVTDFLALDCEMVGVGYFKESALGRISIVNEYGYCVYDTFVNPLEEITDLRTQYSGIRMEDLISAPPIDLVVEQVANIVMGRTLIGHSIHNDLEVLKISHPLVNIRDTAQYFQHSGGWKRPPALSDLIKNKFNAKIQDGEHSSIQDAQATLGLYLLVKEEWEEDALERRRKANLADTVTDITRMHIEPRSSDLFTESENIFIRPNKLEGAYYSCEEYKDIHFRLLMEDVLRPLRADIRLFKQRRLLKNHFKNIRIAASNTSNSLDDHEVDFEVKSSKILLVPIYGNRLEEIDWDDRNIFLTGSLLILSPDNFRTFKCAKIIDIRKRREDSVVLHMCVNFLLDGPSWTITDKDRFEMIESQAFFLPYEYTLNFLQNVDLERFSMKKYIVDAVTKFEIVPHLLKRSDSQIDFSILMKNNDSQRVVRASPLDYHRWPCATDLNLDESQYEGLQKALTQELTIIQGPPGTGKSHLSLQIIKMFLTNKWLSPNPILIISYTNHALDELLESILTFLTNDIHEGDLLKAEQSLLRIGGGSTSNAIVPCTMKYKKEMLREKTRNQQLINSLEKALCKVRSLDFSSRLIHQGIINFKMIPQIMIAKLETNEITKDFFKIWNNVHKEMQSNVFAWFGLNAQSVKKRLPSLISMRDTLFLLLCDNLQAILNENFPQIPTTLKELSKLSESAPNYNPFVTRWGVYFFLVDQLANIVETTKEELASAIATRKKLEHYVKENQTLQNAKVIGMTTTGAVKYKKMVETKIKSSVVIVEEAAHVLEAYVVASLTEHCTQLILVGDHKQLRPMIADHNLKETFLDVSLQERLVQNGIAQNIKNWTQLKVQHRMRAEIAELISPIIYDELDNHPDVETYPNVKGCAKNLFFVEHEYPETQDAYSKSRYNEYEAKYIIGLLTYFTACGYLGSQITVICTYLTQKTLIENTIKDYPNINEIQICTVDGYQGKQNDLIILSLVRNNSNGNVGFLATDNRVCVALSRARHGLIMVGNMRILAAASDTWSKIRRVLVNGGKIGRNLPLTQYSLFKVHHSLTYSTCSSRIPPRTLRPKPERQRKPKVQLHLPATATRFVLPQMPAIVQNVTLACGHVVSKSDSKIICKREVRKQLPCGHGRQVPCNETINNLKCDVPIAITMTCGHTTSTACHKRSTVLCMVKVEKIFSCGHRETAPCYQDICSRKITEELLCGHRRKVACIQRGKGPPCSALVVKTMKCGHTIETACHKLSNVTFCKVTVSRTLQCGHTFDGPCSMLMETKSCGTKVVAKLKCGHMQSVVCSEVGKNTKKCGAAVQKKMKCGHTISVACFLVSSAVCTEEVIKTFPCGHTRKVLCKDKNSYKQCRDGNTYEYPCGHKHYFLCGLKAPKKCNSNINVRLSCGHTQSVACHQNPLSIKCRYLVAVGGGLKYECHKLEVEIMNHLQARFSEIRL